MARILDTLLPWWILAVRNTALTFFSGEKRVFSNNKDYASIKCFFLEERISKPTKSVFKRKRKVIFTGCKVKPIFVQCPNDRSY